MRRLSPSLVRTTVRAASRPTIRLSTHSSWRHVIRRAYASGGEHDSHSSGSDLPWAIGSAAVFFPSAYYLWQQGPEKGSHSHGHEHDEDEHEEGEQESDESEEGDKEQDSAQEENAEKADSGGDTAGNNSSGSSSEDESSKSGGQSGEESDSEDSSQTPETSDEEESAGGKEEQSPEGEGQPEKKTSKLDKRRPSTSEVSKSQHPYMGEPGKSTKSEGVHETAKLSGTVDPYRKQK